MWYYSAPHWHSLTAMCCRVISTFRVTFSTHRHSHKSSRLQSLYRVSCGDNVASDWSAYLFQEMQNCLFLQLSLENGYKTTRHSARTTIWKAQSLKLYKDRAFQFKLTYIGLLHVSYPVLCWCVRGDKRVSQQGLLMLQLQYAM